MNKIKDWLNGIKAGLVLGIVLFAGICVSFFKLFFEKPDHKIPSYEELKNREEKINEDIKKAKQKRDRSVTMSERIKSARERARKRNRTNS